MSPRQNWNWSRRGKWHANKIGIGQDAENGTQTKYLEKSDILSIEDQESMSIGHHFTIKLHCESFLNNILK